MPSDARRRNSLSVHHGDESLLRERLQAALKEAADRGDERATATLRLVWAAIKERDQCAREEGEADGLSEEGLIQMLRDMVEHRRAEIARCENSARLELAEREAEEIDILERFLPHRMSENEIGVAVDRVIAELMATKLKDAGKVIALLKERFNGQMDFASAKRHLCRRLH